MKEFIIAIKNHHLFGLLLLPAVIAKPKKGKNIFIQEFITPETIENYELDKNNIIKRITEITHVYSDKELFKRFSKKDSLKDFLQTVDNDLIEKQIRPFIERRIHKCLEMLKNSEYRIFEAEGKKTAIYAEDELKIRKNAAKTIFNFHRTAEGTKYFLSIEHNNTNISLKGKNGNVLVNKPCWLRLENNIYYFDDIDGKKLHPFFDREFILSPKRVERQYFERFVLDATAKYKVNAKGFDIVYDTETPQPVLYVLNDLSGDIAIKLMFKYQEFEVDYYEKQKVRRKIKFDNNNIEIKITERQTETENKFADLLIEKGLTFSKYGNFKIEATVQEYEMKNSFEMIEWFNTHHNTLVEEGFQIEQKATGAKFHLGDVNLKIDIKAKRNQDKHNDWFDIKGTVWFGKFEIAFASLFNNIRLRKREFKLPDGTIAIIPIEWFAKYSTVFENSLTDGKTLRLPAQHFMLINDVKADFKSNYYNKLRSLLQREYDDYELPQQLNAQLRSYQTTGYNWLMKLKECKLNGCLADDMGLGKTLQAISLISKNTENEPQNKIKEIVVKEKDMFGNVTKKIVKEMVTEKIKPNKTNLVIAPVSLIYNWMEEINKFAPHLRVIDYRGTDRHKLVPYFKTADVVITSYGTVRRGYELLKNYPFEYIILDESQLIKNPSSKGHIAVKSLKSKYRLILTGTPIENTLLDMWAQMNFLNPGLLGGQKYFRDKFLIPIEKQNNEDAKKRLTQIISPFIMRRTKAEVAKDLPELTEQVRYSQMSEEHYSLYEKEKSQIRNVLLEKQHEMADNMIAKIVLRGLMRLRLLANHPQLLFKDWEGECTKFNDIISSIENIIAENHKVLIYSSFVKHLDIYARYFDNNNIKYEMLTGKVKNREQVINKFKQDDKTNIFLITLKTGGVGLNLTEADYVFIIDPWWNPASENQAIARVHRIGQTENVFAYRFITKDSLEEKIIKLQQRKGELADRIIGDSAKIGKLSMEELKELFN